MDNDEAVESLWRQSITAHAGGLGAASAVAALCLLLAGRGQLTPDEVAFLREAALLGFDSAQETHEFSDSSRAKFEAVRQSLDDLWRGALDAAERATQ